MAESAPEHQRQSGKAPKPARLFISYSHADKHWLDNLLKSLKPLFREAELPLAIWSDKDIGPGEEWSERIQSALQTSSAAVLIVSPDFLNSPFIMDVELPCLAALAKAGRLQILWVAARPSVVVQTDIGKYQALHDPTHPLAELSEAQQEAQLVKICTKIKEAVTHQASAPEPSKSEDQKPDSATTGLKILRRFDLQMSDMSLCLVDAGGRVWCSNGKQVQLFRLNQDTREDRWLLPKVRWKTYGFWQGNLLLSDWAGNLRRFRSQASVHEPPFYAAREDDLPIHRLAVAEDGRLLSAAWNGCIRVWKDSGQMLSRASIPDLPLHLVGMPNGALAVADQAGHLRVFDEAGRQTWVWQARGPIAGLWPCALPGEPRLLVQVGSQELHLVRLGDANPERAYFPQAIVGVSRRPAAEAGGWTVVAQQDGRVDWVSDAPFQYDPAIGLKVDFTVRQVQAVINPQAPTSLFALGLTSQGDLFCIEERQVKRYQTGLPCQWLHVEATGRFLLLQQGEGLSLCRNPVWPPVPCQVGLARVNGTLRQGALSRLSVVLVNQGTVPICGLGAELAGISPDLIAPVRLHNELHLPILPKEEFELQFLAKAMEQGTLPLRLRLELMDEGGPPGEQLSLHCEAESRGKEESHAR